MNDQHFAKNVIIAFCLKKTSGIGILIIHNHSAVYRIMMFEMIQQKKIRIYFLDALILYCIIYNLFFEA